MTPQEIKSTIELIDETAHKYGIEDDAYFVGGYPRTLAMGLPLSDVHDLDVATGKPGRAKELAGFVAEASKGDIYEHTRITTVTVTIGNVEIDFQGSENHYEVAPYVRLWGVEETPIAMNIFDRDFTVNALAIKFGTKDILDFTKRGITDIQNKKVVSILPPDVSIPKNPLMITRAIKVACKYGFDIDPQLWKMMKKHANLLKQRLTPQRLSIEAYVLSKYPQAKEMIDLLEITYLEAPNVIALGREEAEE